MSFRHGAYYKNQLFQTGDEYYSEDCAFNTSEPSHDYHYQVPDRFLQGKGFKLRPHHIVDQQGAGHARIECTNAEGEKLVAENIYPHRFGSPVVVPYGYESPARPGPHEVFGKEGHQNGEKHAHIEEFLRSVENYVPEFYGGHGEAGGRFRHTEKGYPREDYLCAQGGQSEVEAFEAYGRDAENDPHKCRCKPGWYYTGPERPTHMGVQQARGKRSNHYES